MERIAKKNLLERLAVYGQMPRPVYRLIVKAIDKSKTSSDVIAKVHDLTAGESNKLIRSEVEPWLEALDCAVYGPCFDGPEPELDDGSSDDPVADVQDLLTMIGDMIDSPDLPLEELGAIVIGGKSTAEFDLQAMPDHEQYIRFARLDDTMMATAAEQISFVADCAPKANISHQSSHKECPDKLATRGLGGADAELRYGESDYWDAMPDDGE